MGMIVGFALTMAILVAAAFGVYCYFNPETRNEGINVVEKHWYRIKSEGDELIDQSRAAGVPAPEPQVEPPVSAPASPPAPRRGPIPLTDPNSERR